MRLMNRNKVHEWILWTIITTLLLVNLACTIVTFAQCTPVWELWQGSHPNPKCWDPRIQQNVGYAQAGMFLHYHPIQSAVASRLLITT